MDLPRLFSIGEVAKLFHMSVSSLRHYEAVGLLQPEHIDPRTGYRSYSTRQFEVLNTIRYLCALDLPLSAIADFLSDRDVERIEAKLLEQREAVIAKQAQLHRIQQKIDHRLQMLTDARTSTFDTVTLTTRPACRIVWVDEPLEVRGFLDMEPHIRKLEREQAEAVVFLGKVGLGISREHLVQGRFDRYDGIFLLLDEEDLFEGTTTHLPEAQCVSIRFHGSHGEAPAEYRKLMDHIAQQELHICGFSREITMIDQGVTSDHDRFVTEISIPISPSFTKARGGSPPE